MRNALRLWSAEIDTFNLFANEWRRSIPTGEPRTYEELLAVARTAGFDPGKKVPRNAWPAPSSTAILRDIEALHGPHAMSWPNVWQLCSGFAHGKRWANLTFSELHTADPIRSADTVVKAQMRGNATTLAVVALEAGQLLDAACGRYAQLATEKDPSWEGKLPSDTLQAEFPAWLRGVATDTQRSEA